MGTSYEQGGLSREQTIQLISQYIETWKATTPHTLVPLLPLLFRLKSKPYNIMDTHFPMAPMFDIGPNIPRRSIWKCARQTGKSTSQAYQGLALSVIIPYFNTLFVTPLFEQIRRFSTNYMRPAIQESLIRNLIVEKTGHTTESVLQRTLPHNQSTMFFSFAYLDAERTRGINADRVCFDEVQGIDREFIPIIVESMSASPWRLEQYVGTPLSKANTMEYLWRESSQGEWAIPCRACSYTNVMAYSHDLLKCLGLKGLICAKCGKAINTEEGYWLHLRPERRFLCVGRHAPQCIFPMHCRNDVKWAELLYKRERDFPKFMMECMAESWDVGSQLVSLSDVQRACQLPWRNTWDDFMHHMPTRNYQLKLIAIDWSGGGADQTSLTAIAAIGVRYDGVIEVGWMKHYPHSTNWMDDAQRVLSIYRQGGFHFVVSDHGGAGEGREQLLIHAGFPIDKLIPITYVHTSGDKALMVYNKPQSANVRTSYSLDKVRSLLYHCELIRQGYVLFPQYESCRDNLEDYLALVEETVAHPRGSDVYLISKADGVPDDMAHAINMGTCAAYYYLQRWPNIGDKLRVAFTPEAQRQMLTPVHPDQGAARVVYGVHAD